MSDLERLDNKGDCKNEPPSKTVVGLFNYMAEENMIDDNLAYQIISLLDKRLDNAIGFLTRGLAAFEEEIEEREKKGKKA